MAFYEVKIHDQKKRPVTITVDAYKFASTGSLLKFYNATGAIIEAFSIGDVIDFSGRVK